MSNTEEKGGWIKLVNDIMLMIVLFPVTLILWSLIAPRVWAEKQRERNFMREAEERNRYWLEQDEIEKRRREEARKNRKLKKAK